MTPLTTAKTERGDKRLANRRLRRRVSQAIYHGDDVMPEMREVSDPWCFAKDGHVHWWGVRLDDPVWGDRLAAMMRK